MSYVYNIAYTMKARKLVWWAFPTQHLLKISDSHNAPVKISTYKFILDQFYITFCRANDTWLYDNIFSYVWAILSLVESIYFSLNKMASWLCLVHAIFSRQFLHQQKWHTVMFLLCYPGFFSKFLMGGGLNFFGLLRSLSGTKSSGGGGTYQKFPAEAKISSLS